MEGGVSVTGSSNHAERHVVLVGASRGLGRAAVEEHLRRGWRVTATVRDPAALAELRSDALAVETLDTTDWDAIDALGHSLATPVDRLFVVAGIAGPSDVPIGEADPGKFGEMMLVNALAPLRLIDRWDGPVAKDGLVAVMSSSQASIALNDDAGKEAYRMSKAALNMGLRSIAARRADGRSYIAINPGWVRTAIGGPEATLSVGQSIVGVVDTLDGRHGTPGIGFLSYDGKVLPW